MADNRNMDFSQMQTGFPPMQGTPVAAATQYFPANPQAAAPYSMIPPGMMAPGTMIAQGLYPVQTGYITAPMAMHGAMMAQGNMPPPPPYTPQMAQSPHAPRAGFPMGINQCVMPGMVPGQMMGGMQPNARPPDDQKKGRHFHEQQMKLKMFGTMGINSTDPDRMIESMFGKMSKAKPKQAFTSATAIDSDPDSFGDFMQGPASSSDSAPSDKSDSARSKQGKEKDKKSTTTPASTNTTIVASSSEEKKDMGEKKDLMAMMLQYSDLKVSQKPKTFQKKTLKDVNPIPIFTAKAASYTPSERSRKWEDVDDALYGLFKVEEQSQLPVQDCTCSHQPQQLATSGNTTPTASQYTCGPFQPLPAWCYIDDDQLPHVYRQVYEASSTNDCILTDRLYPILLLSGLPRQTLREIWEVCNMTTPGQLMKPEMYFMLTLIAIAQNNQGVPSIEILKQLHSPPVPYFNQAPANILTPPGLPQTCPTSAVPSPHIMVPPRPSLPQEMPPACPGMPQHPLPSTSMTMGPVQYATSPRPTLETTFGLTPTSTLQVNSSYNTVSFNNFSKDNNGQMTSAADIYGDDDFADFQTAPKITSETSETENVSSPLGTDLATDSKCAMHVPKPEFETLPELNAEDKYSNVRNFFCSDDSSGTSTNSFDDDYDDFKSADSKPSDDTSQFSTSEQSEAGREMPTIAPPSYDIAIKNSSLTSEVQPVDDDESGWADFQTSSSCMDSWADFNQGNFDSNPRKDNLSSSTSGTQQSSSPFTEQKYSVYSESSSFDLDSTHPVSSTASSSLVTILKDNLQKKEILSLFKVRDDLQRVHPSQLEITTGTSGEGGAELGIDGREADIKRTKSKKGDSNPNTFAATAVSPPTILARSCRKQQQDFKKITTPVTASDVSLDLSSSDMDLYQEPPPMDDQIEGEDEFGGFSQEIEDFELPDRTNYSNTAHRVIVRPGLGLGIAPRGRTTETTVDGQSSIPMSQSGNFDFVDEDSHSSKDTDSLSWQDVPKFHKEDSQSVSSLELSYNSAGRPTQRDSDLATDSQSVSSSEFPAFETLQKQETALESKSLDSLEFRNDEPVWGEICDNSGEIISEDNKNRNVQNLTAETNTGPLPPSTSAPSQSLSNLSKSNSSNLIARDRYSSVIEDVQGSDRHCHEWTKCLNKCYQKIKEANNVFNSISTSTVCNEVIKSGQGADYIMAIIEIYRVVCKITVTMRMSTLTNERLETLLKDIDLAWNNLAAFLSGSSLMAEVSSFKYTSAVLKTDDTASQLKACGVCLLNVDVMDRASNDNERAAKLTYSGRQYHATCANFWVNCVDSMLPALKLPQLI